MKPSPGFKFLKSRRVAVLKGGWSRERAISLKTGAAVEAALKKLGLRFHSLDVHKNIADVLKKKRIQFCFICLHGPFGEDGQIQHLLETLNIPYTGSGPIASSLAMNKETAKVLFLENNIPTPPWVRLGKFDSPGAAYSLLNKGSVFVKPVDQGSALGISRCNNRRNIKKALQACFRISENALVERYIQGRELTVGILGRRALPVIEIKPAHAFYDYYSKYAKGGSHHLCPAPLPKKTTKYVQNLALKAFQALGCRGFGRVDFILDRKGKLWTLEVNTIPGMTATSLFPEAAKAAGISFERLMLKLAELR